MQLFENIANSKNEKIIIDIYNGFSKKAFELLKLKNIENELNNFLIAEIDSEEFNKHFYEDYTYDLIPKIVDFTNYIASDDGDYKVFGQCKMYEYNGVKNDENLINVLFLILLTYSDTCSLNGKKLEKLEKMFRLKNRDFNFSFVMMIDSVLEDNVLVENRIITVEIADLKLKSNKVRQLLDYEEHNMMDKIIGSGVLLRQP